MVALVAALVRVKMMVVPVSVHRTVEITAPQTVRLPARVNVQGAARIVAQILAGLLVLQIVLLVTVR